MRCDLCGYDGIAERRDGDLCSCADRVRWERQEAWQEFIFGPLPWIVGIMVLLLIWAEPTTGGGGCISGAIATC